MSPVLAKTPLSGWGRWPVRSCINAPLVPETAIALGRSNGGGLTRGMGRSYGDIALNPELTLEGTSRNCIRNFDPDTGTLTAEAGLTLAEILDVFAPRGWFPKVTPGTKFVSLGGLIAADAHGKNHHMHGSFGDHVDWFDLLCADGKTRRCSRTKNTELFNATIGGCGLTGHILLVQLKLLPIETAWIVQKTIPAKNLDEAIEIFETSQEATYSVAWIDCLATGDNLGRSLVLLGEHATRDDLPQTKQRNPYRFFARPRKKLPMDAPSWALNQWTIKGFNALYYRAGLKKPSQDLVDYDTYFYPLDAIHDWNRLYGSSGFVQYQCALPTQTARDGLAEILDQIARLGMGSFLSVLKRFGPGSPDRPLSFPLDGYTLALDFACSPKALTLLNHLDEIIVRHGGRLYLAKDSRMSQATFEAGYGDAVSQFRTLRRKTGAKAAFSSLLSKRLNL